VRQDAHEQLKMQSKPSKGSFKQEEKTTTSRLPFIIVSSRSNNYLKVSGHRFSLDLGMHINKDTNMFELQLFLIQPN
jgi:hypothetical protein